MARTSKSDRPVKLIARQMGSASVLRICGSAGISDTQKLRAKLDELLAAQPPLIVLDLGEMDFICSEGLGAMINAHLKSRHYEGKVKLANPTPAVRQLLETTRLTHVFGVYATVEQAVESH